MAQAQYQFLLDLVNTRFESDLIARGLAAQDQPSTYDITNKVMEASVRRGRENELDPFGPGSMTLLLDNTDWRFTPDYGGSPLYGYLRPGAMVTARVPVPDYAGLVSWWTLDESSASTRYDSYGTNHLSVGTAGTVNVATGHVGNGARVGNLDWLQVSSNSTIQAGDTDFSVACWVKLEDSFTSGYVASKSNGVAGGDEWVLWYDSNRFKFIVYTTGGAATTITASTFGAPVAGTWYFLYAFHDSVNNVIGISVNNGTIDTSSYSAGVCAGSAAFVIGAYDGGAVSSDHLTVDNFSFWRRVLPSVSVTSVIGTLILDQFTDANGTSLASHTIAPTNVPATSWTNDVGAWTIQGNKAQVPSGTGLAKALCDAGVSDATVSADVDFPNTSNYALGIVFRVQDTSNYWIFFGARDSGGTPYVRLIEVNAGVLTTRGTSNQTLTGLTKNLEVVTSGTSITCYLDSVSVLTYTSSSFQTATQNGVYGYTLGAYTQSTIDNFQVVG